MMNTKPFARIITFLTLCIYYNIFFLKNQIFVFSFINRGADQQPIFMDDPKVNKVFCFSFSFCTITGYIGPEPVRASIFKKPF